MVEVRKHKDAFTKEELRILKNRINLLRDHRLTSHAREKILKRGIDETKINKMFSNYDIIELHKKSGRDIRVLLRSTIPATKENICIVMDLYDGTIVTCYCNESEDKHKTLRQEEYNSNIDVILEVKKYINRLNKYNTYKNKSRSKYSQYN